MTKSKVGAELKKQTQKILIIQLVFMKEWLMKFLMNY